MVEFDDILHKDISNAVWIPLWWIQTTKSETQYPEIGSGEEFVYAKAVMATEDNKDKLMSEDRSFFNPIQPNSSSRWENDYLRADTYYVNGEPTGEHPVLYQYFGQKAPPKVHVNQDLIFALDLVEEGDNWIRPDEGYDVVIRQTRNETGNVCKVEIKTKYLKDYLCAQGKGIVFVSYRSRTAVFQKRPPFPWAGEHEEEKEISPHTKWYGFVKPLDDRGDPSLGGWVVLSSRYKNIKTDDVPKYDPLRDADEMLSETRERKANPVSRYRAVGELEKREWIAPGAISTRVGNDKEESLEFLSEADGSSKRGEDLSCQPQWLWFESGVINRILQFRGSALSWHTAQTGSIAINSDWPLDFGINKLCLVNVLAKDIVVLPRWQQEIWKGYNVSPDGGVSEELQMAQMQCNPAETVSPEDMFFTCLQYLQDGFKWATNGVPLYKDVPTFDVMKKRIHRFVVQKEEDVCRLAKDIIRDTAESFNVGPLWPLVKRPDEKKKLGSLKTLERFLTKFVSEEKAHDIMSPLFYLYDLRGADAHPVPQEDIAQAKEKLGLVSNRPPIWKGAVAIQQAANALYAILRVFQEACNKQNGVIHSCGVGSERSDLA